MSNIEFNVILSDIINDILGVAWDYNKDGDALYTEDVLNIINMYKKK